MNIVVTPPLSLAQEEQALREAPFTEPGVFAAVLEEKLLLTNTTDSDRPGATDTPHDEVDTAMVQEEALAAQKTAMELAGMQVLPQLTLQVDNMAHVVMADAIDGAAEGTPDESIELLHNLQSTLDNGPTLATTSTLVDNRPTAAAMASLPQNDQGKRERPEAVEKPEYLLKPENRVENQGVTVSSASMMNTAADSQPLSHVPVQPLTQTATTVPTAAATPVASAVIGQEFGTEAWKNALNQQISVFTRNGIQNAEIRLTPQDLGHIRIHMQLNSDQAALQFVSENHQVRAAMEAAIPQLRTLLAESGIQLSESRVGAESFSSWNDGAQREHSASHTSAGDQHGEFDVESQEHNAHELRITTRINGINIFA